MVSFVNIFEADGKFIREIRPYADSFKGGVRVATGDVDGDGVDEVFTAPGPGIPSNIAVYSGKGEKRFQTTAYDKSFIGGAHIASIDMDADGKADIVVSPGPGGGPHVRIFNGTLSNIKYDFFRVRRQHDRRYKRNHHANSERSRRRYRPGKLEHADRTHMATDD